MREVHEQALREDGDGYHDRNHAGIGTIADPAFEALSLIHRVHPITSVLELGCTTGFRLEKARVAFGAHCSGLEVSPAAVAEGRSRYPDIELQVGVAPRDMAQWAAHSFDIVVVGHFMYLLPPEQLFGLAAAVDRLVAPGGHIIVMDFLHPRPMSAEYHHHPDLRVTKHDPSAPWLWSPTYTLVSRRVYDVVDEPASSEDPRNWQTVDVIRKFVASDAYPAAVPVESVHHQGSDDS